MLPAGEALVMALVAVRPPRPETVLPLESRLPTVSVGETAEPAVTVTALPPLMATVT